MRMSRLAFLAISLTLLCSLATAPVAWSASSQKTFVHMVVVGVNPVSDTAAQDKLSQIEKGFLRLAGGFTRMGWTQGGSNEPGQPPSQTNVTYMVSAKRKMASEISMAVEMVAGERPFILVWPGERWQ